MKPSMSIQKRFSFLTFLFLFFSGFQLFAQTDGLHYQAVIIDRNPLEIPGRDVSGNYLSEGKIALRFTIFRGVDTIEYQEIQQTITDKFGLVSLIMGKGERIDSIGKAWNRIEWDGLPKQLQVEIKFEDSDFLPLSREELLFVPYAAHRKITASETVIVDGATTLRTTLETFGAVKFHDSLTVDGMTHLKNQLLVEKATTLNSNLTVENESPTLLTGSLDVWGKVKFKGDLDVGGKLKVGDSLIVMGSGRVMNNLTIEKSVQVQDSLSVNGPGVFNQNLQVAGPVLFQNNLKVEGGSDFNNITVQNLSQLNGNLNVAGNSALSGTLDVAGTSNLNNNLNVSGPSNLNNSLNVSGPTNLNGTLNVNNGGATNLSGPLKVSESTTLESSLTVNSESELNGQVTINTTLAGDESNYEAYPLRVQGSNQGVAIKLNGRRTQNNNFLTFYDGTGKICGAVEGQTLNELVNSSGFILETVIQGLELAAFGAEAIACGTQLDFIEVVALGISAGLIGASIYEFVDNLKNSVGVSYSSGGADYAEWLEKTNPNELLFPGEVVGVLNGKISKNTDGAHHFMVISTNPAVLGNLPKTETAHLFEKVAFLGQVPVRVAGMVKQGDYIIPSGNQDGMAIAFSPENLPTEKFKEIIGVAWQSGKSETANVVNVAVGLTINDLAKKVSSLEAEVKSLKQDVAEIHSMLQGKKVQNQKIQPAQKQTPQTAKIQPAKSEPTISKTQLKEYLDKYGYVYEKQMLELRNFYKANNIHYQRFPDLAKIIDHPKEAILDMHDGKIMKSVWPNIQRKLLKSGQMD